MAKKLICLLVCMAMIDGQMAYSLRLRWWKRRASTECASLLAPDIREPTLNQQQALATVFNDASKLVEQMGQTKDPPAWYRVLKDYILPYRQTKSNQLAVALVGPANSGKSTIINSLAAYFQSPTDISRSGFAELSTSRPVILVNPALEKSSLLTNRFGPVVPWQTLMMTSQEGLPVVYPLKNFYKNLILIDVPSSDSDPLRTIADKAVRWADILAYTFTYTSYRNDINLQQLRDTFARIGQKPVILIYRAPASMPKRDADAHFKTVTQAMFPNATINPDTGLPTLIKGVYILLESDKVGAGYAIPVLKPYGKAGKKLWDVLQNYDSAPLPARRQSLQNNFTFVVNGINKDIINLQREQAERKVTDEAFQLLMKASVDRMLNMFPYDRLASDLQEIWIGRHQGIHQWARWLAHPLQMARGHKTVLEIGEIDRDRIEYFLDSAVEQIVNATSLAASRRMMKFPLKLKGVERLLKSVDEMHKRFGIPEKQTPNYKIKNETVEFYLPDTPKINSMLNSYLHQDWDNIKVEIKKAALETVLRLTYTIQAELDSVVGRTRMRHRLKKMFYSGGAVAPAVFLTFYIFFSGVASLKALFGAFAVMVNARILTYFDERTLKQDLREMVANWFNERQSPFFIDQLNHFARFDPKSEHVPALKEFGRLRAATRVLREHPPQWN